MPNSLSIYMYVFPLFCNRIENDPEMMYEHTQWLNSICILPIQLLLSEGTGCLAQDDGTGYGVQQNYHLRLSAILFIEITRISGMAGC